MTNTLPKDWEIKTLGDICEKIEKCHPSTLSNDTFDYYDISSVNGKLGIADNVKTIHVNDAPGRARQLLMPKDVIISTVRPNLKASCSIPTENKLQIASTGFCVLRSKKVLNKYLFYIVRSDFFVNILINNSTGASYPAVTDKTVKNIQIPIPPLKEQEHIVAKIDVLFKNIDTAIANTKQSILDTKEIFQSTLNSTLTNDKWEIKTLGEQYDVRDGTHDSPKYLQKGRMLITSKNLKNGEITLEKIKYIQEKDYLHIIKRSFVEKGDVLFAMIGTIGNPVVIKDKPDYAIKNVALFKVSEKSNSYFLKYYLSSSYVIKKMKSEAKGATQKFVGLGYLRQFPIPIPPLPEQKRIVKKLDDLSSKTQYIESKYNQKLEDLKELKQSILEQAFKGKL